MNVVDRIKQNQKTAFSFEVLPPLKGKGISALYRTVEKLREFDPQYVNITTHRSEYVYTEMQEGVFKRERVRRRPGTVAVAAALHNKYGITTVPHILCSGFSKQDTEYILLDLQFLGITDVLLLRGDKARHQQFFQPETDGHEHAIDLQEQINAFNRGELLNGDPVELASGPFSYGVACYPEKHEEAPCMEQDLYWLKKKVEAGADYAVTQMFFDNQKYFDFVDEARRQGITIPIIPGIKPLKRKTQLNIIPKTFKIDIPQALAEEVIKCHSDQDMEKLGVEWCIDQCKELMAHGVPSIHFYTTNAVDSVREIAKAIY